MKTRALRRFLTLILCLVLTILSVACQSTNTTLATTTKPASTTAGTTQATSTATQKPAQKIVLTAAVPDNVAIKDFNTNKTTLLLEEKLGCDLQYNVYASKDYSTKLNLMVQAGDKLEDILMGGFGDSLVYSWADADAIVPLTKYYKDASLAVNINEAKKRTGVDFVSQLIMPDGEIYGIPQYNQSYGNEYPAKLFILKPWLDQIGMKTPTTTDELYNVMKAIVKTDLNGNKIADEIGMVGWGGIYSNWFSYLMGSFVYTDYTNNFMKVNNGVISYAYTTQEWKEGLKYIKKLFDAGIISSESITMDYNQWTTFVNTKEAKVFGFFHLSTSYITADSVRRDGYVGVAPMVGANGVKTAQFNPSKASVNFVVSSDCKNPEAAFKVGDLMCNEYFSIMTRWGEEGVDWDYWKEGLPKVANPKDYSAYVPGFDIKLIAYADEVFWTSAYMQNSSYKQTGPFVRQYGIANGRAANPKTMAAYVYQEADANTLYQKGGFAPKEVLSKLIYTAEESKAYSEIDTNLKSYVESNVANFIMGKTDIDAGWDKFVNGFKDIGMEKILKIVQGAYNRMK